MKKQKVMAKRRVRYQGVQMIPGNFYEMTPQDIMVYRNDVRIVKEGSKEAKRDYTDVTKKMIIAELEAKGIEADEKLRKDQLIALLENK